MTKIVVSGAKLRCTLGSTESSLNVNSFAEVEGEPIATVADGLPSNVGCFGTCSLSGTPCAPITTRWIPGSANLSFGTEPALTQNCCLTCIIGGIISIIDPGQSIIEND
jgi:hypothetical protein